MRTALLTSKNSYNQRPDYYEVENLLIFMRQSTKTWVIMIWDAKINQWDIQENASCKGMKQ